MTFEEKITITEVISLCSMTTDNPNLQLLTASEKLLELLTQ